MNTKIHQMHMEEQGQISVYLFFITAFELKESQQITLKESVSEGR